MKTNEPIVLTIFGNERCVVSCSMISKPPRTPSTRRPFVNPETSANPSTLGAEIEGQIRLINAESGPSETEAPSP